MSQQLTIVIVRALGLSGATWFNLVLGSHPETMAMGPPSRILDLPADQADQACFVHRERCELWPAFLRSGDRRGRFFADLAGFTGKRIFVVNYPPKALIAREIEGKEHRVLHVRLQRDGRASLFSRMRHYGTLKPGTAVHHIVDWQIPKWDQVDRKMPSDPSIALTVRHEDMVRTPEAELDRIGDFIGIRYAANATRFWEYSQHLTAGNTGVLDMLCRLQGEAGHVNKRANAYADLAGTLGRDPQHKYLDESWIEGLSREDKLAFDCLLGERNAQYGYVRDTLDPVERENFLRNLDAHLKRARQLEDSAAANAVPAALPPSGFLARTFALLRGHGA